MSQSQVLKDGLREANILDSSCTDNCGKLKLWREYCSARNSEDIEVSLNEKIKIYSFEERRVEYNKEWIAF